MDNPTATGDRELAVRELESVADITPLTEKWQLIEIDLAQFKQRVFRPPFPRGLDANTVNKIVFFVTPRIAGKCNTATLSFRDVTFQPSEVESIVPSATSR